MTTSAAYASSVLAVTCPWCIAPPWRACFLTYGTGPAIHDSMRPTPHSSRVRLGLRAVGNAQPSPTGWLT